MQVSWLGVAHFLTTTELYKLSLCSKELHGCIKSVALILCKDSPMLQFLLTNVETNISILMWLRCLELQYIKTLLLHATPISDADSFSINGSVIITKSFVLTCRKQCIKADKLLKQGPKAYKSMDNSNKNSTTKALKSLEMLSECDILDISESITCEHSRLRPLALSKSHGKRMTIPLAIWKKLYVYFTQPVFGAGISPIECVKCVQLADVETEARNQMKSMRLLENTSTGNLFDLVMRKNLYPLALFSPEINNFYLVPLKWMKQWRSYVRSSSDILPGPILNGDLLCARHKRPVIPTSVGLFLAGASNSLCQLIPGIKTIMYEIVTAGEWEDINDQYCAEVGVGFAVVHGTVQWHTTPCQLCAEHVDISSKKRNTNNQRR